MRLIRRLVGLGTVGGALVLAPGCFNPEPVPEGETDASTGTGVLTDTPTTDPTASTLTAADTTAGTGTTACTADNAVDDACPSGTPYCSDGTCVDCTGIDCAAIDPAAPACDTNTGVCETCSDTDATACAPDNQVCVDNACAPCTENAQCVSEVCLLELGQCLLDEVEITGTVFDYSQIDQTPMAEATVRVTNVSDLPIFGPTEADGAYSLTGLIPGSLLDVELLLPQDDPVFVPAAISSRQTYSVPNQSPTPLDLQVVPYNWMAQVAFECGIFDSLDDAIGVGAVNTYFIQRSTIFGQLVDENGDGVPTVSRAAISAELNGWANFQDNLLDVDTEPAQVCFLEEDAASGTYVGTDETFSNESGRFVVFRVRNDEGLGQGQLAVRATGFDDAFVTLSSSGNVGVVNLVRNDDPIPRDFAIDIYPVFTTYGCIGCHTAGGPPGAVHDGFEADWSLTPRQVWENMVGPGTVCNDPDDPHRVCTNDPELSLFVTRPLTDAPGEPDVHPIDIFPSIDDPTLQVIIDWISQGALPPTDVQFEEDIYPLFQKHACVACHTAGGPPTAVNMGFNADWDLTAMEVYNNLVGPGTTCPDPDNPVRICTDDVLNSRLVTYPLTDKVDEPDSHPVNAFNSSDDPDLQLIIQWIAQGASFDVSCEHDECTPGEALNPGCSECAAEVCATDPFCCNTQWDPACVGIAAGAASCSC
ncbi:MAG: carboxypeptidase-like regulatory domain-containing protein [Myxococcota bacterium]